MRCQHCGNEFWASLAIGDSDFCSPMHRRRFHKHLRAAIQLIEGSKDLRAVGLAPFQSRLVFNDVSHSSELAQVSYPRPIRTPEFGLAPTGEALAPKLAYSDEAEPVEQEACSEAVGGNVAAIVKLQASGSDHRPQRIAAIVAEVREILGHRRGKVVALPVGRKTGRVIEFPRAV